MKAQKNNRTTDFSVVRIKDKKKHITRYSDMLLFCKQHNAKSPEISIKFHQIPFHHLHCQ